MRRVIAESVHGGDVLLDRDEQYHLIRVLRLREGDFFEALASDGRRFKCRLVNMGGQWQGTIAEVSNASWESPCAISLAQALIKRDKFEWVVQKAVELGVSEIRPLISARTEIELNERRTDRRMERWNRILSEAVKQCGRTRIPRLHEPASLRKILESMPQVAMLAPDEEGTMTLADSISALHAPSRCCVFIGPEGGWDEADRCVFREFGVSLVRVGPRILRAETAAVSILSLLQYEMGDLKADPATFRIDYRQFNQ
jgi:16S rRNA (uracil1498-N3)-methyltransferase